MNAKPVKLSPKVKLAQELQLTKERLHSATQGYATMSERVTARGLEIEDLKKQLSWTKQMCQNLTEIISHLSRNK